MNYRYFYVFMLSFWDLISPIVSLIRQTGEGSNFFNFIYYIYVFCVMLFSIYILFRRSSFSRIQIKYFTFIVSILFISTLNNIIFFNFEFKYFFGQASSWLLFIVIFMCYENKMEEQFELLMANILLFNIFINILFAIIFRLQIFGANTYFTFDISGILLSTAYIAKNPKKIPLFLILISSFIAMKRAILLVNILVLIFSNRLFNFAISNYLIKFIKYSFIFLLVYSIYLIYNLDLILVPDLSIAERFAEVKGAVLLFDSYSKIVFGNGLGWFYPLYMPDSTDFDHRGFTHISPVYIIVSLGLFGVFFVNLIYGRFFVKKESFIKYTPLMLFGLLSLVMSFSRLNILTDPIVAFAVSSLILNKSKIN